jgi:hypothetical protein
VIVASSPAVGTVFVLQFAALLKSPPTELIQLTAASIVRRSSASIGARTARARKRR